MVTASPKLKLHGFNNLTKSLTLCIYDINYAKTPEDQQRYINYIDQQYNTKRLTQILENVCQIIGANALNIASQSYEPQGASVTILVSEKENAVTECFDKSAQPGPLYGSIVGHLDKSHICVHTYPESHPVNGISTFRADIEIASCGVISPLKALNYLIHTFHSDIVTLDYRVRGFTRDINGDKHYIDHKIDSIQNFIAQDSCEQYTLIDMNMKKDNIFHTKMMLNTFDLANYIFGSDINEFSTKQQEKIKQQLTQEMQEIFSGNTKIE